MKEIVRSRLGESFTFSVDEEDSDLDSRSWNVYNGRDTRYYLTCWRNTGEPTGAIHGRKVKYVTERLHVVILERKLGREILPGMEVDHKDRNTFNNSRSNLREATPSQNRANSLGKFPPGSAHGVVPHRDVFKSQISLEGRTVILGYYNTLEEASTVFQRKHAEVWGEFSPYWGHE